MWTPLSFITEGLISESFIFLLIIMKIFIWNIPAAILVSNIVLNMKSKYFLENKGKSENKLESNDFKL